MPDFFGFLPPEMAQAMQRQNDQVQMFQEAQQKSIEHLLDALDPEDLATLRMIFRDMVPDEKGRLAAYYEGVCASMLRVKYDRCPGCGGDHDSAEHLLDGSDSADSAAAPGPDSSGSEEEIILAQPGPLGEQSIFENKDAFDSKPLPDTYVDASKPLVGQKGLMTEDLVKKMVEYNVDDLRDEDTGAIIGFKCLGCGMNYQSLEDRMLRAPDDCHGCQHKSAWG